MARKTPEQLLQQKFYGDVLALYGRIDALSESIAERWDIDGPDDLADIAFIKRELPAIAELTAQLDALMVGFEVEL